jgi:hypothetical protein
MCFIVAGGGEFEDLIEVGFDVLDLDAVHTAADGQG